ncbi:Transcription initiation factor TFIID subunit like [Quillaja saponaria]|uniref:Transcription initiation factor TFIID subunit like n=1 Tax=Quillaja saponaria TaxID=32244 RepID=A0AAD7VLC7_QUISA|nr:Transcription initiation factor TFIID subunit like [Quillaja saponaria]
MSTFKLTAKFSKLLAVEATSARTPWRSKAFVTSTPLQGKMDEAKKARNKEEKMKREKEAADKRIEEMEAVQSTAVEVRKTCEFVRDTGANIVDMTKHATDKVSEAAETITVKTKNTVSGALGTAKNATDIIKDTIVGK